MQKPRTLQESVDQHIIDNNINITLENLFKTNSLFYINKKPYTIVGSHWKKTDWQIDKKPIEKLLEQFSNTTANKLEEEAKQEEDDIPEALRQGNLSSTNLTEEENIVSVASGLQNTIDNASKDKDKNVLRLKSFKLFKNPEFRLAYMFPDTNLRKVLTRKYDLIHGFSGGSIPSLGLFLAKLRKVPYVFTYNTRYNQYTHYILNGKLIKPKVVEVTMAVYCNQCDVIVAPSEFISEELKSFGVKKPIKVIPNGIDIDKFNISKSDILKKQLELKKDDKIILYMGRLAKEKDVDFLIESFKIISNQTQNSYLVIAGDGPEKQTLEKLTKKLNLEKRVIFLGYVAYEKVTEICL